MNPAQIIRTFLMSEVECAWQIACKTFINNAARPDRPGAKKYTVPDFKISGLQISPQTSDESPTFNAYPSSGRASITFFEAGSATKDAILSAADMPAAVLDGDSSIPMPR